MPNQSQPDYRPDQPTAPKRDLFDPLWDPYDLAPPPIAVPSVPRADDLPPPVKPFAENLLPPPEAPIPVAPTAQRAKVAQDVAIDLAENDIYGKWFAFHLNNPHVYGELRKIALQAKEVEGKQKFGIGALTEVLRWRARFKTEGADYRMPNAFRAMYARLLMEQEKDLANFFDTAELRSAVWPMDTISIYQRTDSVIRAESR